MFFRNMAGKELFLSSALKLYIIFNKFVRQVAFFFRDLLESDICVGYKGTLKEHWMSRVIVTPVVVIL